jgi:hypothetical protein
MRCLLKNKRPVYYSLFEGTQLGYDDNGLEYFSPKLIYGDPVKIMVNVSPARGKVDDEQFGLNDRYDKVIVTDDMNIPVDNASRLWVDTVPEINSDGSTDTPHDYVVTKVAKGLYSVSIAITKVSVGASDNGEA